MILNGRFVTLRPLSPEDAEITLKWRLGPRAKFLQRGARTVAEQRSWIESHQRGGEENYIIETCARPVGMVALHDINLRNRNAMIGRLLIGEPEIVGSSPVFYEAELILCDYAFDSLKIHKLYGEVMEGHEQMLRTRLYLGYRQDGVLRDHYLVSDEFKNAIAVSLLEEEYRTRCRPKLQQMIAMYRPSGVRG